MAGLSSAIHMFDEKNPTGFEYDWCNGEEQTFRSDINPWFAFEKMRKEGRPEPRFYLACGRRDDLCAANEDFKDFLIKNEADVTWDEEENAAHEWDFWDSQIKKVLDWLP